MANFTRGFQVLLILASLVVLLTGLKLATDLLTQFMLAFFLAVLGYPVVSFLRNRRFPKWLAVLLTVVMMLSVLVGLVFVGSGLATDFQDKIDDYALRLQVTVSNQIDGMTRWVQGVFGEEPAAAFRRGAAAFVNERVIQQWVGSLDFVSVFNRIASVLKTTFFVILLVVFMLAEGGGFGRKMAKIRRLRGPNFSKVMAAASDIQKYLGIKTIVSAITGVLAGLLCYGANLDFPLLWAMVAFGLNYIPAIGSVIASLPPIFIALVLFGLPQAIVVLVGYLIINITLGNFVEPMLLGRRFGISTLVVIVSVIFWGWIWGWVGMFLAVPLTMLLKVLLDDSDEFAWLGVLIGKEPPRAAAILLGEAPAVGSGEEERVSG
ncbi:MAG: AI-2E family transporter [Verrucomicrobiota bacterium]